MMGRVVKGSAGKPEDEALLAEWHEIHPVMPWKGQDGKGGFVGWANRLDERVARRGYLMPPRSAVIPIARREVHREVFAMLRDWRALLLLAVGVVAFIISPLLGSVVIAILCSMGAKRVRARRRGEMRAELYRRSHPEAERLKSVAFDLAGTSAATRAAVSELLTATLTSPHITDQDIETYAGCTPAELARTAKLWADADVMSLADGDRVWKVVSAASTLDSWHQLVPGTPADDLILDARDELEQPLHDRIVATSRA